MNIYIANSSSQKVGGGWTFISNFRKGMGDLITDNYDEADIYFIASPTMVSRVEVHNAKTAGKKIVLRLDNAVRNSRNRNTGMTRMQDFAELADLVIYQSDWAKAYLQPFTKRVGEVIINGTDLDIYQPADTTNEHFVFYSRFNRDETKNYEVARYWFSQYFLANPQARLFIAGQFSQELRDGNFDFYMGEPYIFVGVLPEIELANIYRQCGKFLYTFYNDACSNSLIEALCSGCEIVGDQYYRDSGGAKQILELFALYGRDYFSNKRMAEDYKMALAGL